MFVICINTLKYSKKQVFQFLWRIHFDVDGGVCVVLLDHSGDSLNQQFTGRHVQKRGNNVTTGAENMNSTSKGLCYRIFKT